MDKDTCFQLFINAIKTDATKISYCRSLEKFKKFCALESYCQFAKIEPAKLKELLVRYVVDLNSRNLTHASVSLYLCSIELFLDMNEIPFPKRIIRKLLPTEDKKLGGELPYTTLEIDRMLSSSTKLRTKALIHFFASTGVRPNALHDPTVKINDLIKLPDGCCAMLLYKESRQEFWSFLTPEAGNAIDNYLRSRRLNGEHFDDDSPLFENKGRPLNYKTVRTTIRRTVRNAGIERKKNGQRFNKAIIYAFRKRFDTVLKTTEDINSNIVEKLMAHKNGLDGVYLKPTMEQCHKEFVKAIINLSINPAERQRLEIEQKQKRITQLEQKEGIIADQQTQLDEMKKKQENFEKMWMEQSFPTIR